MQDLQLMGVHEDGEHLLLSGADDGRFRIPVDEALRTAILRDRPHLGHQGVEVDGELRPREVQALIRAGASADEAAHRAGWSVEKVHRYEGPILAEREHVAGLARTARLRTRGGSSGSALRTLSGTQSNPTGSTTALSTTLSARVAERLKERGVEVTDASWDSWRAEAGPWTVVLTFAAGGRQRQASWNFDLANRTVSAVDDEARWLSEDVQSGQGPIPAPRSAVAAASTTRVYDVEAEGGLRPTAQVEPGHVEPGSIEHGYVEHPDDPLDLMTAMRERSTARGRRKPGGRRGSGKAASGKVTTSTNSTNGTDGTTRTTRTTRSSAGDHAPEQTLPLEPLEPETAPTLIELADEVIAPEGIPPENPPPARQGGRRTGRPSVPKWDEIIFGARPGTDRSTS